MISAHFRQLLVFLGQIQGTPTGFDMAFFYQMMCSEFFSGKFGVLHNTYQELFPIKLSVAFGTILWTTQGHDLQMLTKV